MCLRKLKLKPEPTLSPHYIFKLLDFIFVTLFPFGIEESRIKDVIQSLDRKLPDTLSLHVPFTRSKPKNMFVFLKLKRSRGIL